MGKQSVVIDLPEDVYNRFKEQADQTNQSVEVTIAEAVIKVAPEPAGKLTPELEKLVADLASLDDVKLQKIASKKFSRRNAERLEALHYKRQATGLSEKEDEERAELMRQLDRWVLLKNEALGLLQERGYDANKLVSNNSHG